MALTEVNRRRAGWVSQLLVFVLVMSMLDVLISDDSVASALLLSICVALVALSAMWWLTRRARH